MASWIVLDWDHEQFHVTCAQTTRRGVQVSKALTWTHPEPFTPSTAERIGKALREFLRGAKIAAAPVIVGLGRDRIFLKELRFPAVAPHEEANIVRFQTGKELTEPIDNYAVDYVHLNGSANDRQIMTVAARREFVAMIQAMCQAAGLKLHAITPRLFGVGQALARAVRPDPSPLTPGRLSVVLTIGQRWAELCFFKGDRLVQAQALANGPLLANEVKRNLAVFQAQHAVNLDLSGPECLYVFGEKGSEAGVEVSKPAAKKKAPQPVVQPEEPSEDESSDDDQSLDEAVIAEAADESPETPKEGDDDEELDGFKLEDERKAPDAEEVVQAEEAEEAPVSKKKKAREQGKPTGDADSEFAAESEKAAETTIDALTSKLALPIRLLDPLVEEPELSTDLAHPAYFAGGVGLVLLWSQNVQKPINLTAPKRAQAPVSETKQRGVFYGAAAAVVVILAIAAMWFVIRNQRSQLELLTQDKMRLEKILDESKQERADVEAFKDWESTTISWLDELYDLTARHPHTVDFRVNQLIATTSGTRKTVKGDFVGKINVNGLLPAGQDEPIRKLVQNMSRDTHVRASVDHLGNNRDYKMKIEVAKQSAKQYDTKLVGPFPKVLVQPEPEPPPVAKKEEKKMEPDTEGEEP